MRCLQTAMSLFIASILAFVFAPMPGLLVRWGRRERRLIRLALQLFDELAAVVLETFEVPLFLVQAEVFGLVRDLFELLSSSFWRFSISSGVRAMKNLLGR